MVEMYLGIIRFSDKPSSTTNSLSTKGWIRKFFQNKALRRFVTLDCNFPCYRPRPKRRFFVRLGFLGIIVLLRIIAIALYATSDHLGNRPSLLAKYCAFILICVFLTFLLDLYHYCVWWHYTPYLDTTCCCCRSRKHRRYMSYILTAAYLKGDKWDNRSCSQNPCAKRTLEHVATFHYSSFKPQKCWSDLPESDQTSNLGKKSETSSTYIGFHQTTPKAAVSIVKSEFLPSKSGMLGPGTYFARSLDGTEYKIGRDGGYGAWFIAKIEMGKVYLIEKDLINNGKGKTSRYDAVTHQFVSNGDWRTEFDTCYCIHRDENLDEFCVKDPATQIRKWIVVVTENFDPKVKCYGLDTEFDSTVCDFI
ncbi:hypothetical protein I4U23_016017 [Adineta vaga]|nr:hypothetical protein I4U23_016017 [Adineta vaga]